MRTYQIKLNQNPPLYEIVNGSYKLYYHSEYKTEENNIKIDIKNIFIPKIINYWLCDVVELSKPNGGDFDKWRLTECVKAYDSSKYVNEFTINGIPVWLDKDTRTGLQLRFEAEASMGKTETTLWYEGQLFTLPLDKAIEMLKAIEVYASKCYNVTQLHLYNINSLEDIKNYDYKSGYPNKLEL